jgi:hypothetical protein
MQQPIAVHRYECCNKQQLIIINAMQQEVEVNLYKMQPPVKTLSIQQHNG